MEEYKSNGFVVGSDDLTYDAQVKSVKDDRVSFVVKNFAGENLLGTYYLPPKARINPHVVFKTGAFWQVKIVKITKRSRVKSQTIYTELNIEVEPQDMPSDLYIEQNPIGSVVSGKVVEIIASKNKMRLELGKNVFCCIGRDYHIAAGATIKVKITGYNSKNKAIYAST